MTATVAAGLEPAEVEDAFEAFHGFDTGATAIFERGSWTVWEPEEGTHYVVRYRAGKFTFEEVSQR